MNTKPDHETLMLWLEDELSAPEQAVVDAWAQDQLAWLTKRDEARRWRAQMTSLRATPEDMPYGEFFQQRVMRAIEQEKSAASSQVVAPALGRRFRFPTSLAAALVLGFFGGALWYQQSPRSKVLLTYTPAEGVKADFYESSPARGTVIVLNGVEALPDDLGEPTVEKKSLEEKSQRDAVAP
jgi:anti-sigma factor RsiW